MSCSAFALLISIVTRAGNRRGGGTLIERLHKNIFLVNGYCGKQTRLEDS